MVNINICARCLKCEKHSPSRICENGRTVSMPSVECAIAGLLFGDCDLPEGCPFVLEQTLVRDNAEDDFEVAMSEITGREVEL